VLNLEFILVAYARALKDASGLTLTAQRTLGYTNYEVGTVLGRIDDDL